MIVNDALFDLFAMVICACKKISVAIRIKAVVPRGCRNTFQKVL